MRRGLAAAWLLAAAACGGADTQDPGRVRAAARPPERTASAAAAQQDAAAAVDPAGRGGDGQILFGDLHVHTSWSWDGMLFSLPLIGGEGIHPPADACDFARACADLDFFALTDHAESITAEQWALSKQSIRECNAVSGDAEDPDLVAFMGFEWSQAGLTPETHWGHRCVIFPGTDEEDLPPRPIGASDGSERSARLAGLLRGARWLQPHQWRTYDDVAAQFDAWGAAPVCADAAQADASGEDCREIASTPGQLHARLDDLGLEALTIPHGTTWGVYTPATSDIARQLAPGHHDPQRQRLIEVMSGHGSSEEYRSFAALEVGPGGEPRCPEPSGDFLPCCWQAGEIMRSRCEDLDDAECERRVAEARALAARSWVAPWKVFPDARPEEWLDCDQCRDCFKPSFNYRPRESVQYALALSGEEGGPRRFRFGFVASSDNHTARPGTGYKQVERGMMTDVVGEPGLLLRTLSRFASRMEDPQRPLSPESGAVGALGNDLRVGSFLYPGGLAAVHARGRSRRAIWEALERREVYGTSGPRILLWFDLVEDDGSRRPMGSQLALGSTPRFEVRAVGDFVQEPGCPRWSARGLSPERLRRLCRDECRNPGSRRHPIAAIEVVRIRPQRDASEAAALGIEDPWLRLDCPPDPRGCKVGFEDPEFAASGRDAVYYVRALQAPTPAINGDPLQPERDGEGRTLATHPCEPGREDGCPAPVHERAWSSPIFVDFGVR